MLDKLPTDIFSLVASFLCRIPIFCKAWNYDIHEQKSLETVSIRTNIPYEEIRKAINKHVGRKTRYLKYQPSTPQQLHQDLLKTHQLKTLMVLHMYRKGFANLPECVYGLQHLHISKCSIPDISFLQNLTELKSVSLKYIASSDIDVSCLQPLVKLESLTLEYFNSIKNVSFLQTLVNLRTLKLISVKKPINMNFIRKLVHIETLSLKFLEVQTHEAITCLPNLRNVEILHVLNGDLIRFPPLSTIQSLLYSGRYYTYQHLQTLAHLEHLEYKVDPDCCYISWIRHLTNLKSLKIDKGGYHRITDISFLQYLTRLQSLSLSFTNISVTDNSHMLCLTELTHLEISCSRCETFNISTIGYLEKLKELRLKIPGRFDLSGLNKLQNLEILDIQAFYECSEFISSLKGLKTLKMCFLSFESLKDLSHLILLEELEISQNRKICDISDIPLGLHSLTIRHAPLLHDLEPIKQLKNLMKLFIREVGSNENQFFNK